VISVVSRSRASWRRLFTPGWLVVHVVTIALAITMVLLGRWQLDVSDRKHFDLQNFGYAIQWWLFTAFALFMWVRVVRDGLQRMSVEGDGEGAASSGRSGLIPPDAAPGPPHSSRPGSQPTEAGSAGAKPVAYRRYVMPTPAAPVDAEHAAYNDYLAKLNEDAERKRP
jgi:DNA-binding transcriptional regulator of glucitol operon